MTRTADIRPAPDGFLDPDDTYCASEIARLLFKRRRQWFYRHHNRLEAEGFPQPISRVGRPRWSGARLIAWRDRHVLPAVAPLPARGHTSPSYPPGGTIISMADATLDQRLAARKAIRP